jgi:hypothetical protein
LCPQSHKFNSPPWNNLSPVGFAGESYG